MSTNPSSFVLTLQAAIGQTNASASEVPSRQTSLPSDLTIRAATLQDASVIADIGARVFDATFAHTCTKEDMTNYLADNFTPEILSAELKDSQKFFTVACLDEQVVAFSCLTLGSHEPCVEHIPEPERIELQRLYADLNVHGKGVARTLMDASLKRASELGRSYVWLGVWEHNYRARRFYERFGFKQVGSHDFWLGEERQTDDIFLATL